MQIKVIKVIIDTGVFIPCGDKPEEIIQSIEKFGNELPDLADKINIEILVSTEVLKEYKNKIPAELRKCKKPLPKFHRVFARALTTLARVLSRVKKCKIRKFEKYSFHVLESSKIKEVDLSRYIEDKEDEKFLKLALTVAKKDKIYLISVDRGSLLKLSDETNYRKFCDKFKHASNIKILLPGEFIAEVKKFTQTQ